MKIENTKREVYSDLTPWQKVQLSRHPNRPYSIDYIERIFEDFEELHGDARVLSKPLGVAACITPWNYPLFQIAAKVGPALGSGCTVVLKPSEVAPLAAFVFAEIIDSIDLPSGV